MMCDWDTSTLNIDVAITFLLLECLLPTQRTRGTSTHKELCMAYEHDKDSFLGNRFSESAQFYSSCKEYLGLGAVAGKSSNLHYIISSYHKVPNTSFNCHLWKHSTIIKLVAQFLPTIWEAEGKLL